MMRALVLMLGFALAAPVAAPVAADDLELYPVNLRSEDGVYRPALQVWRTEGPVEVFRSDDGSIPARSVLDARAAIAFVVARFGLTAGQDTVAYCPAGIAGLACVFPQDPWEPANAGLYRVYVWP